MAIYCKDNDISVEGTKKDAGEMKSVVELWCLQGEHGSGAKEECAWALTPPTNSEGFVVSKVWVITRIKLTSLKKVAEARPDS